MQPYFPVASPQTGDQGWENRRGQRRRLDPGQGLATRIAHRRFILLHVFEQERDQGIQPPRETDHGGDGHRPVAGRFIIHGRKQGRRRLGQHLRGGVAQGAEDRLADRGIRIAQRVEQGVNHRLRIDSRPRGCRRLGRLARTPSPGRECPGHTRGHGPQGTGRRASNRRFRILQRSGQRRHRGASRFSLGLGPDGVQTDHAQGFRRRRPRRHPNLPTPASESGSFPRLRWHSAPTRRVRLPLAAMGPPTEVRGSLLAGEGSCPRRHKRPRRSRRQGRPASATPERRSPTIDPYWLGPERIGSPKDRRRVDSYSCHHTPGTPPGD